MALQSLVAAWRARGDRRRVERLAAVACAVQHTDRGKTPAWFGGSAAPGAGRGAVPAARASAAERVPSSVRKRRAGLGWGKIGQSEERGAGRACNSKRSAPPALSATRAQRATSQAGRKARAPSIDKQTARPAQQRGRSARRWAVLLACASRVAARATRCARARAYSGSAPEHQYDTPQMASEAPGTCCLGSDASWRQMNM